MAPGFRRVGIVGGGIARRLAGRAGKAGVAFQRFCRDSHAVVVEVTFKAKDAALPVAEGVADVGRQTAVFAVCIAGAVHAVVALLFTQGVAGCVADGIGDFPVIGEGQSMAFAVITDVLPRC